MARTPAKKETELRIDETFLAGQLTMGIIGLSPLIYNRMALKARGALLFPSDETPAQKKKSGVLKHDPLEEYRNSVNRRRDGEPGPTRLIFPAPAFKGAMATAATDVPSIAKTKINRLTWIQGYAVDIYGLPQLFMTPVKMADPGRTADIRTRALLPEWGCLVTIRYMMPIIKDELIATLASLSGMTVGIGDYRQEKGRGSFGQFELVQPDDARLRLLMDRGGMAAQDAALANPECFDQDSEDLFSWFIDEQRRRESVRTLAPAPTRGKGTNRRTQEAGNGEARA